MESKIRENEVVDPDLIGLEPQTKLVPQVRRRRHWFLPLFLGAALLLTCKNPDDQRVNTYAEDLSTITYPGRSLSLSLSNGSDIRLPSPIAEMFRVGANLRGVINYGKRDILRASRASDTDIMLRELQKMDARLVRVFVANNKISADESAKRLGDFLDKAAQYNISVVPSLIDLYGSGFNPQGTDKYYFKHESYAILDHDFFDHGYRDEYASFVKTVIFANRNKTNIYAWEIGNELKDDTSPESFVHFMRESSSLIKSLDPGRMVATGMLSARHTNLSAEELYSKLPDVDVVTVHPYNSSKEGSEDVVWARLNGKVAIVEEMGLSGSNRVDSLREEISYWRNIGASAILQWGFLPKGLSDNGDGDRVYGIDNIFHNDYDILVDAYRAAAQPVKR